MKLTILISFILLTSNIYACKCGNIPNVTESVNHSDIVFSGQVISKIRTSDYKSKITSVGDTTSVYHKMTYYPMHLIKIRTTKIYKGQTSSDTITIITGPNSASCGFNFEVGRNYIVYGFNSNKTISSNKYSIKTNDNKTYWTHQCSRTDYFSLKEESDILLVTK